MPTCGSPTCCSKGATTPTIPPRCHLRGLPSFRASSCAVQEQQLLDDFAQTAVLWLSVGLVALLALGTVGLWQFSGVVSDGLLGLLPPPPDPFVNL